MEERFPVERLNPVAMAEGNAKKPVYQMHKWWARRLGSVFRTITLAALCDDAISAEDIWRRFREGADLGGKVVLDPFMGGGTPVVEALRLGCRVIGLDISPVAWFVTKKEVELVDLAVLDEAFRRLGDTVGRRIRSYYGTTCPRGHRAEAMYYFWVKVSECGNCGARVRLFPNYVVSRRERLHVSVCPECLQMISTPRHSPETRCGDCGRVFDPGSGVSARGAFRCHACGHEERVLDAVARRGSALELELHGLEGYCVGCGRFFKRVDEEDLALLERARREFARRREALLIPRQAIPTHGRSDPRPVNHGYTHFWQLFNERQLVCLSALLEGILAVRDRDVRELLLLAFSDCLDTNNMFCKYEADWHKVSVFFGLHAYHPIERPTENNVWGTEYGRGSFVKCFQKVRRGKEYCRRPYERLSAPGGRRVSRFTGGEQIAGRPVGRYASLRKHDRAVLLKCKTSERLEFVPDRSVDAVITDPPYLDNVQYSELADFFYVWLRLGLKDQYRCFAPELSSRSREIVKNEKLGKTTASYGRGMLRVFKECSRVLKEDGSLVFTFHHARPWAWELLVKVLLGSGFWVESSPVVRSEGKSGFHSSEGNIRYDCVLMCRKGRRRRKARWITLRERALGDAARAVERIARSGLRISEADLLSIVMGKVAEHYTKAGGNVVHQGAPYQLSEALAEIEGRATTISAELRNLRPRKDRETPAEQLALSID